MKCGPRQYEKERCVEGLEQLLILLAVVERVVVADDRVAVELLTSLFFVLTGSALHNNVYVFTQLCTVRL